MDISNIAITGVSGRFPKCAGVEEFKQALFKGDDLITDNHNIWNHEIIGTPPFLGIVEDYKYFDAGFFDIGKQSAEMIDPRCKKLLEVVYESIIDAGINPKELRGSKTGVFLALMQTPFSDSEITKAIHKTTYMMANWISYIFDLRGPSMGIDTGCSSSISTMNEAVNALSLGQCEAAIVCSAQAQFLPYDSMEFNGLGVLSPQGRCKVFDKDRDGYVKSEAVISVLLQRKEQSRRIYATVQGIGCNTDGYNPEGIIHPSSDAQMKLIKEVYKKFEINPNDVSYVECHGTGTMVGDMVECESLSKFFVNDERNNPLLVGSVKTNMGHAEGAGGLASIVKVLIAIQNGIIPGNLNFQTPAVDIPEILSGNLQVVSEDTSFPGGLIAVNSFGLGGSNAHLILKPYVKHSNIQFPREEPRLVLFSGRTQTGMKKITTQLLQHKENDKYLSLVDEVFSKSIKNHNYRGYVITNEKNEDTTIMKCTKKKPSIWFSYSGMGSQWPHMGRDLMRFEVFRCSVMKCSEVLKQYDINLEDILVNGTTETFKDPINCFTGIVAVSIGLTDLLNAFGVIPDRIIGHSLGEIGCAYADGSLTAEQAILVGYARGWATKNTFLIPGLMASVGLSIEECQKLLPEDIFIACDNCTTNVTISGPEESVKKFVQTLAGKNIFVKIVDTGNVAYHSKYIYDAAPHFLQFLRRVIPEPKPRSSKWLSSAVEIDDWKTDLCQYSSAEYHCHNFTNRVLFRQVLNIVPNDVILVEIAPRGLLQAIFRRSLMLNMKRFYLVEKDYENNEHFFLSCIGKIYLAGAQPNLTTFYKSVFPVGPETPMLAPLITWKHSESWNLPKYEADQCFGKKIDINVKNDEYCLLSKNDFNEVFMSWCIVTLWKTFGELQGIYFEKLPVEIYNLKFCNKFVKNVTKLKVNILKSGKFEMSSHSDVILTGKIRTADPKRKIYYDHRGDFYQEIKISGDNFYKLLELKGVSYNNNMKLIETINFSEQTANVEWKRNWIHFISNMFLVCGAMENANVMTPTGVSAITIVPGFYQEDHMALVAYNYLNKAISCACVELKNIKWTKTNQVTSNKAMLKCKCSFVPYITDKNVDEFFEDTINIILQIIAENSDQEFFIKIAETIDFTKFEMYKNLILNSGKTNSIKNKIDYQMIEELSSDVATGKYNLIVLSTLLNEISMGSLKSINENSFILTDVEKNVEILVESQFVVAFRRKFNEKKLTLLKKVKRTDNVCKIIDIKQNQTNEKELSQLINDNDSHVVFVQYHNYFSLDDINDLQKEFPHVYFQIVLIEEYVKKFSLKSKFYRSQIERGLRINVLKNGEWGAYKYLLVEDLMLKKVGSSFCSNLESNLKWVEESPFRNKTNEIRVIYSSLDYWDNAANRNSKPVGLEYSGINLFGDKVMGISLEGSLRTHLKYHRHLTWSVPVNWNLNDAATIPMAYSLGYYGLFIKGNLHPEDTVLVNYTGKSIELAAIYMALNTQCQIVVGANSPQLIKQLHSSFPNLKDDIIDLSDYRLIEQIMSKSNGSGIDIIFNCSTEDILLNVLESLNTGGVYVKIDLDSEIVTSQLVEELLNRNCVFYNITIDQLLNENRYVLDSIADAIYGFIKEDAIVALPHRTISAENVRIQRQFGNGKTLVKVGDDKNAQKILFNAVPRTYFNPDKSYIIFTNLEIFEMEIIDWLVERGIQKIILNTPATDSTSMLSYYRQRWSCRGCTVIQRNYNVSIFTEAESLVNLSTTFGFLGGLFNIVALSCRNDETINRMYDDELMSIKNMDLATRQMKSLEYFVVLTSNNSDLEYPNNFDSSVWFVMEKRKEENHPATGIKFDKFETNHQQNLKTCVQTLDQFLQLGYPMLYCGSISVEDDRKKSSVDVVKESILYTLGLNEEDDVDFAETLSDLGMDSLAAFELKSILEGYNVVVTIKELKEMSLENILKLINKT